MVGIGWGGYKIFYRVILQRDVSDQSEVETVHTSGAKISRYCLERFKSHTSASMLGEGVN